MNAKELATFFHEHYEALAPTFGYVTKPESRGEFQPDTPNGQLSIAVCERVLERLGHRALEMTGETFDLEAAYDQWEAER